VSDERTLAAVKAEIQKEEKIVSELLQKQKKLTAAQQKSLEVAKAKIKELKEESGLLKSLEDMSSEILALEEERNVVQKKQGEAAKSLGDSIQNQVEALPFIGQALSKQLNLQDLGDELQKATLESIGDQGDATEKQTFLQKLLNLEVMKNPYTAIAAALLVVVGLLAKAFTHVRDMAGELGVSMKQAAGLQMELGKANAQLIGTGKNAKDISGELLDTFGTLDSINAKNIADIGRLSAGFGVATKDVIGLQKALTDTLGVSVNQSEAIIDNIGQLAKQEGVAAGKVIEDIAANTEKFAAFAKGGADGFAQAAIEAAKIGTNLSTILTAADSLLDFESSLTNEFEAQVLTGKNLNLEKARQLALDGDIAGLTQEIQQQVGSMGDLQAMNVVQRKSLADSIGITVDQLTKISRGEAVAAEETVQDLQKKTNEILKAGFSEDKEKMDELISTTAANSQTTIYE